MSYLQVDTLVETSRDLDRLLELRQHAMALQKEGIRGAFDAKFIQDPDPAAIFVNRIAELKEVQDDTIANLRQLAGARVEELLAVDRQRKQQEARAKEEAERSRRAEGRGRGTGLREPKGR